MRIITISALALALSALGARAQTTSTTDTSTTTNPAKLSSGAEDKGAATMPNTQSSGSTALPSTPAPSDKSASAPSDPAALPNDKPAASASDVPAAPSDNTSGTTVIKKHRKHNKGQGRSSSDTSGMHRAKTSGTDTKDPGSLNAPAPSDSTWARRRAAARPRTRACRARAT
jgi:hypothetical protein